MGARAIGPAAFVAAVVAHLPALGTWWCLDDWGLLARAAGILPGGSGLPARWLSQRGWWAVTWPLLGLEAPAHAWLRVLLHAVAALTVVRIARRASLGPLAQLAAGLLYAATPVAFTPLYWAAGIQELLAGVLSLLAIERWLAGGCRNLLLAGFLGAGAILAKESALALPLFLAAILLFSPGSPCRARWLRWGVVFVLAAIAAGEALLVLRHFAHSRGAPYELGGPMVMLGNLGKFGWWLPTPGPVFTGQVTWSRAGVGIALWLGWAGYGLMAWRRGQRLPLATWAGALLSLAPALPLVDQARPYMGYLAAAALSLSVAALLPRRLGARPPIIAGLVIGAVLWGQWTMRARMDNRRADGSPADPIVRAAHVSRESAHTILELLPPGAGSGPLHLVILQVRVSARRAGRSDQGIVETPRYVALAGPVGVRVLLGKASQCEWTDSLLDVPAGSFVICEKTTGLQAWGFTRDALLYAAELAVVTGDYEGAVAHLSRAVELDPTGELAVPAADVLGIPGTALRGRAADFQRWLEKMARRGRLTRRESERYSRFLEMQ